jgi:uncharacterized protein (TIGR00266 family)
MQHRIDHGSAFALATLTLEAGESCTAEAGAMVSMTATFDVETGAGGGGGGGGFLKGLKRAALGGTSFFMNTFTAKEQGELALAPRFPGDIAHRVLGAETTYLTSGNFLACTAGVDVDTKWGGAKTFFSGEGLFLLKVTGPGELLLASYGAVDQLELAAGQKHVVDSGHLVGFTDSVGYEVRKFAGWKSTILGGEGLVAELTGPGTVWLQTRSLRAFVEVIAPMLPEKSSS